MSTLQKEKNNSRLRNRSEVKFELTLKYGEQPKVLQKVTEFHLTCRKYRPIIALMSTVSLLHAPFVQRVKCPLAEPTLW